MAEEQITENTEEKKAVRHIEAIDRLFDVSAVDIPAYDDTQISARNELLAERQEVLSERHEAERLKAELDERRAELKKRIESITGGHDGEKTE